MKKGKIKIGQCYEYQDHVYMVIEESATKGIWIVEDTLSKEHFLDKEENLLSYRRPFNNCG